MATSAVNISLNPSRDTALRAQYDQRACWEKVVDTVVSIARDLFFILGIVYLWISGSCIQQGVREIAPTPESRGLVVLIHGLHGCPELWHAQLRLLQDAHVDLFSPLVRARGVCSLDEAAQPILSTIVSYARQNPEKPVCLLGLSNGSRIATWLETHLREEAPQTRVKVSTIAGVHLGSSRMDLLNSCGISRCFYPAALRSELGYDSLRARELLNQVRAPLPEGCAARSYEFYATTEDLLVPDIDSSLPLLNKGEQYHVVHAHGHCSIITAVAEQQVRSCVEWIRQDVV